VLLERLCFVGGNLPRHDELIDVIADAVEVVVDERHALVNLDPPAADKQPAVAPCSASFS
jgi:hypothetical protein